MRSKRSHWLTGKICALGSDPMVKKKDLNITISPSTALYWYCILKLYYIQNAWNTYASQYRYTYFFKLYKLIYKYFYFAVRIIAVVLLSQPSNEGKKCTENTGNWKLMCRNLLWNSVEPAEFNLYRMSYIWAQKANQQALVMANFSFFQGFSHSELFLLRLSEVGLQSCF